MSKKVELYSPITEEAGVIMVFSKIHEYLGFPKLVPSSSRGFDIADIEYKGKRVTVEFEYLSENYIAHEHHLKMIDNRDYVLICYEDNCNILKVLRENYNKTNIELIEIKKYVDIKQEKIIDNTNAIEYIVLNYNPANVDNITIDKWKKTNVYGLNANFSKDTIVPGSKILFKQGSYIVARCDVVRYEVFEKPISENEWNLFYSLVNYPIGLSNLTKEEWKEYFGRGYIFYDEFEFFDKIKIKFDEILPNKKMNYSGKIKITKEEYYKLLGN